MDDIDGPLSNYECFCRCLWFAMTLFLATCGSLGVFAYCVITGGFPTDSSTLALFLSCVLGVPSLAAFVWAAYYYRRRVA
jgi:hypothetical protein